MNFQMFKLVLEKAEEPETKLPTSAGLSKKQRGTAGGCARVTAGQKRPHLALCSGPSDPLQGRQGSRVCITDSPGVYLQCLEQRQPLTVCERGKRRLRGRLGLSWMWGSWDEYLKALKDSLLKNRNALGFRNFPVVKKKNPSANAGDAGSILGLRRSLDLHVCARTL